jgi:hypothetical protein
VSADGGERDAGVLQGASEVTEAGRNKEWTRIEGRKAGDLVSRAVVFVQVKVPLWYKLGGLGDT